MRTSAILLTLLAVPAWGREGLAWQWSEGETRTFLLRSDLQLAEVMWVKADLNRDARVVDFAVDLVTTCGVDRVAGKKGWQLRCHLDDLSIRFGALPNEPGVLGALATEMDETYSGADIVFRLDATGRIRSFDIEGVDKFTRRIDRFQETMRQMFLRTFAPLDIRLPRHGSDRDTGTWTEVGPLSMGFPSEYGTVGRSTVTYTLEGDGDVAHIAEAAEGMIGTGEIVNIGGVERMRDPFDMHLTGTAAFDTVRGVLLSQEYETHALPTASAQAADVSQLEYVQRSSSSLLDGRTSVELPASGER